MSKATKGERMQGQINRIMKDKGFGFIKGEDGQDYFMHFSACRDKRDFDDYCRKIDSGEEVLVEFTPTQGSKGPRAEDVVYYG